MKLTNHQAATVAKLKNRRIGVKRLPETDNYLVEIMSASKDLTPRAVHLTFKNKIVVTAFKLSSEAALALFVALHTRLTNDGVLKINQTELVKSGE